MAGPAGRADHRADIYSLGVTFYEMLTGDLPVADYKPPSGYSAVDRRVDRVVARSLKSSPDKRYQRASHVKQDVERISARPRRRWGAFVAGRGRRTAVVAAAVVAVCLLVVRPLLTRTGKTTPAATAEPAATPPAARTGTGAGRGPTSRRSRS